MRPDTKTALRDMLADRSVLPGPITLSNGSESKYYFDCKKVTLSSDGAALVGDAFLDIIEDLPERPEAIGGLTHGADPIVSAVMLRARDRGLSIDGFYVRKVPKEHGTKNKIENAPRAGTKVVVVDDVVTQGTSVLQAVESARQAGCEVVAVLSLVDRLEGGRGRIEARVHDYRSVYDLGDFRSDIERVCQQVSSRFEKPSMAASA